MSDKSQDKPETIDSRAERLIQALKDTSLSEADREAKVYRILQKQE